MIRVRDEEMDKLDDGVLQLGCSVSGVVSVRTDKSDWNMHREMCLCDGFMGG